MKFCKRILPLIAILVTLCVSGCRSVEQIKNIKVTSWSLESVTPSGLRSLNAELAVEIENPAMEFTLEDIRGTLHYKGEPMVDYVIDPVTILRKCTRTYPVSVSARLSGNFPLLNVLAIVARPDPADFTTDIDAKIRFKSGISKDIHLKNVPIKDFIE